MGLREKTEVMTGKEMNRVLHRIARELVDRNRGLRDPVVLGIQRRGVYLAARLRKILQGKEGTEILGGELDITLYRDDLAVLSDEPVLHSTMVPTDISGKTVILVDDVIFTGRTVRAALEALMDLGRPSSIQLVVLVDRGHRELPVQPDYLGATVTTSKNEVVEVHVRELDGEDRVCICEKEAL
ncbi:MAG: bifunctional pyr operon transcriptional regulator/uracil phosphoribosyltransferase [Dethiosulfovibrio peptidovorans]|nr:MAG: bifunctional pyr operon transcriptional regulator/uracil phosphoribosyltransferase [Dethiosulfovibrio peptidovorans]